MINATAFIEHLTNRDVVGISQALNIKNDLLPYIMHKLLFNIEASRLNQLNLLYTESLQSLSQSLPSFEDPTKQDQKSVLSEAKKVNPLLFANLDQIHAFLEMWAPKLNPHAK